MTGQGILLILGAMMLLVLPVRWIGALLIGITVHELGHVFSLYLLRLPVRRILWGTDGLRIITDPMTPAQEFLAAASGPICSLLLLCFRQTYPELAICGMIQGIYNLLPIYPSDGGRILAALLWRMEDRDRILLWVGWVIKIFVILAGIGICVLLTRWTFLIVAAALLLFRVSFRNTPCKDAAKEVK